MDLSVEHLRDAVVMFITLILSIAVHEFGHAFVADRLGDRLPRSQGRVTLNPMAHADPIGTLLIPGVALFLGGGIPFGWGRPVQINPASFSRRFSMRIGHMLVSAAGPAMNLLFGILISLVLLVTLKTGWIQSIELARALDRAVILNFVLMFFNLLPIRPLDGATVLEPFIPLRYQDAYERFQRYGPFILIGVLILSMQGPLAGVLSAPPRALHDLWMRVIGLY